jgi:hypothetical protein
MILETAFERGKQAQPFEPPGISKKPQLTLRAGLHFFPTPIGQNYWPLLPPSTAVSRMMRGKTGQEKNFTLPKRLKPSVIPRNARIHP